MLESLGISPMMSLELRRAKIPWNLNPYHSSCPCFYAEGVRIRDKLMPLLSMRKGVRIRDKLMSLFLCGKGPCFYAERVPVSIRNG